MMQSATSDQPKIRRKADHGGYVTPLGVMPPVTTILAETSPPESKAALEAWKQAHTAVEYQKTGAKRGTWVHSACEHYHNTGEWQDHLAHGGHLRSMIPWIEANVVESVLMEVPELPPQGVQRDIRQHSDFCAEWPELTLLDYKTSERSKIAMATYLENYWDRLGAYSPGAPAHLRHQTQKGCAVPWTPNRPSGGGVY